MLTYKDLVDLLNKHPEHLNEHIVVWDRQKEEWFPISNAFINNSDSPTSHILDKHCLVLTKET